MVSLLDFEAMCQNMLENFLKNSRFYGLLNIIYINNVLKKLNGKSSLEHYRANKTKKPYALFEQ